MTEHKKRWLWSLGLFAALFVITTATCWHVLSDPEQVLAFNDGNIESMLSPVYRLPEGFIRLWDNQFFFGSGSKQYGISIVTLFESIGPVFTRRVGQPLLLALCGLAIYWSLRQFRFNRPASALTSAILIASGWATTFALTGLAARPLALACAFMAMGFAERGRVSGTWLPYAIAGGFLGMGITEVPDVGAIMAVTFAFIFLWTHLAEYRSKSKRPKTIDHRPQTKMQEGSGTPLTEDVRCTTALRAEEIHGLGSRVYGLRSFVCGLMSMVLKLALVIALSVLIAWQTLTTMFATQIAGVSQGDAETPAARYAWATQWSIPPTELWNTVSGSYFGTSMRSTATPYWGRNGRTEGWEKTRRGYQNFSLTGWHLGVIPSVLCLALPIWLILTRRNKDGTLGDLAPPQPRAFAWMLCIGALLSAMLMVGKYFAAYRLLWMLPFFDTIRNPEKWNGPLMLFAGLAIALILDALSRTLSTPDSAPPRSSKQVEGRPPRRPASLTPGNTPWQALIWSSFGLAAIGLLIVFWTQADRASFIDARTNEGYGSLATLMWNNALGASIKVFLLAAVFGGAALWIAQGLRQGKSRLWLFAVVTVVLTLGDLMALNRDYAMPHKYRHFMAANPLTDYLDAHRHEGRLKLIPPQHPLLNNLRLSLLQIKGYDLFEPISVSRMPADYESLFKAMENNPVRLWELGAVRYFLTLPGATQQLNQMDGNRGRFVERLSMGVGIVNEAYLPVSYAPQDQHYLRLVEFTGALPVYRMVSKAICLPETVAGSEAALRDLAQPGFDLAHEAIIQSATPVERTLFTNMASISVIRHEPASAAIRITSDYPGLLIRAVKYDPDWKINVDNHPATLLRANYLFQGVMVPSGQHTLTFTYSPSLSALNLALAGRGLLLLLLVICLWPRSRQGE